MKIKNQDIREDFRILDKVVSSLEEKMEKLNERYAVIEKKLGDLDYKKITNPELLD